MLTDLLRIGQRHIHQTSTSSSTLEMPYQKTLLQSEQIYNALQWLRSHNSRRSNKQCAWRKRDVLGTDTNVGARAENVLNVGIGNGNCFSFASLRLSCALLRAAYMYSIKGIPAGRKYAQGRIVFVLNQPGGLEVKARLLCCDKEDAV